MKKLAALAVSILALGVAACGGDDGETKTVTAPAPAQTQPAPAPAPEPTPEPAPSSPSSGVDQKAVAKEIAQSIFDEIGQQLYDGGARGRLDVACQPISDVEYACVGVATLKDGSTMTQEYAGYYDPNTGEIGWESVGKTDVAPPGSGI